MSKNHKWTEEDDLIITKLLSQNKTIKEIANVFPNLSLYAIKNRVRKLSGRSKETLLWTEDKVNLLKDNYLLKTFTRIGQKLGRTTSSVQQRAVKLGLKKTTVRWTKENTDLLKELYPSESIDNLVKIFNNI